jgi:hypothetical protein
MRHRWKNTARKAIDWNRDPCRAPLDVMSLVQRAEGQAAERARTCRPMDEKLEALAKLWRERRLR